jgi:hypothetical protein
MKKIITFFKKPLFIRMITAIFIGFAYTGLYYGTGSIDHAAG